MKNELLKLLAEDQDTATAINKLVSDLVISQLSELLPEAMAGAVEGLNESITEQVESIRSELVQSLDVGENEDEIEDSSPVAIRLKNLEKQLAESEAKRQQVEADRLAQERANRLESKYQEAFEAATGGKVLHRSFIYEVLKGKLGDLDENSGNFLTKDGKTLNEVVSEFFGTDVGKHFIDSGSVYGLASAYKGQEASLQPSRTGINAQPQSTADALASAFSGGF